MNQVHSWVVVGAVTAGGVLFFAAAVIANRLLRPSVPSPEKLTTYESGVDPVGRGWSQTMVRYYLYAFLYVVFAVDAVYLFPWATVVARFGLASVALERTVLRPDPENQLAPGQVRGRGACASPSGSPPGSPPELGRVPAAASVPAPASASSSGCPERGP